MDQNTRTLKKGERLWIRISLYASVLLSFIYIIFNLVKGVQQKSLWFGILAVYYLALFLMRYLIYRSAPKGSFGENLSLEFSRYRICGCILFVLNILLTVMVALFIERETTALSSKTYLILLTLYDLYLFGLAVADLIKFRKYGSPLLSGSRAINFTAAMVTLLSLETTILNPETGTVDPTFRLKMIAVSGAVVCAIVLIMSVYMVIRGTVNLKKLKN